MSLKTQRYTIWALFGVRGASPRFIPIDANVPHNTTIENTLIASYGRVFPSAIGIVQGDAHDNTYSHNDIYDGYHSAVEICALGCPWGSQNSNGSFNNVTQFTHASQHRTRHDR